MPTQQQMLTVSPVNEGSFVNIRVDTTPVPAISEIVVAPSGGGAVVNVNVAVASPDRLAADTSDVAVDEKDAPNAVF